MSYPFEADVYAFYAKKTPKDGGDKASSSSSSSNPNPETLAALRSSQAFLGNPNPSEEMNVVPEDQSALGNGPKK